MAQVQIAPLGSDKTDASVWVDADLSGTPVDGVANLPMCLNCQPLLRGPLYATEDEARPWVWRHESETGHGVSMVWVLVRSV